MSEINLYHGDAKAELQKMPDKSVHCCVTSPPYYGLRDYGVDGQIGLEETPELYVQKLVDVFREVKRVLRDDGTLWLNLGDSYNGSGKASGQKPEHKNAGRIKQKRGYDICAPTHIKGLKPKDLIGIPWAVARALRGPFYNGRILDEKDRVWLAAMVDAEGCMFIHKRKTGQNNGQGYSRKNDSYGPGLEVANTHRSIVERCQQITGLGSICTVERETKLKKRNIPLHRWNLRSLQCRDVIKEIYPYLVGKKHEARILLGCPSSGPDAKLAHESLIALHNGKEASIDFAEPESLYEPGFYLRQDIIWHKKNQMPESVTDRCTKSHEYIFLLSKKKKYYYDVDAIKSDTINPDDDAKRITDRQDWDNKNTPDELRNGIRPRKTKKPSGWDLGDGPHGTIHRNGREQKAEYTDAFYPKANKRSVWTVTTKGYKEAHFATFPEDLIVDCIKAGCPEGGTVLDPFAGACTTLLVSHKLNRNSIGIELNAAYIEIGRKRLRDTLGMFTPQEMYNQ